MWRRPGVSATCWLPITARASNGVAGVSSGIGAPVAPPPLSPLLSHGCQRAPRFGRQAGAVTEPNPALTRRRLLALGGTIAGGAVLLVACGGDDDAASTTGDETATDRRRRPTRRPAPRRRQRRHGRDRRHRRDATTEASATAVSRDARGHRVHGGRLRRPRHVPRAARPDPGAVPDDRADRAARHHRGSTPASRCASACRSSTSRACRSRAPTVEIWHCDIDGDYSAYADGYTDDDDGEGTTFLRGSQVANADGIVEFLTVYPGWYAGRAVHIHAKVHIDDATVLTTQFLFDDALNSEVMATEPYAAFGEPNTTNAAGRRHRRHGRGGRPPLRPCRTTPRSAVAGR